MSNCRVLWLRPTTGDHVSIRRERIANHLVDMGIDVTICDASGLDALDAIKKALTGNYDVILGNVRIGLYLGYPLARVRGIPFFGDVSDPIEDIEDLPEILYRVLFQYEWWILDHSDACFVVESQTYEKAKHRGLDPIFVTNAVDYPKFAKPAESIRTEAQQILESDGVDIDAPVAIYIGSMVSEYHLSEIVQAASMTPDWEFAFVGEDRGANISDLVAGCSNAHYIGAFEYELMPGFLSHASCGLCLVNKEQPLKIMEYGAAGLPTLGYDGKLRNNFSEEELLFVSSDPEHISKKLTFINESPDKAKQYGLKLQQKAKENSWKEVAKSYYDQLQKVSKQ